MSRCLIAVGANLGDRLATIERALALLREHGQIGSLVHSAWRETAAIGGPADQPAYLNGAIAFSTGLSPTQVLAELQAIEQRLGRDRQVRWGARTIDLDLLLYDDVVLTNPALILPHPRMAFRKFVIEPAADVAPEMRHPQIGWTMSQLYEHLLHATPYVAIAGVEHAQKSSLAEQLVKQFDARSIKGPALRERFRDAIDAPGPLLQAEIEWLRQVEPLVRRVDWPDPTRLAVSDFWVEEALAYSSVALAHVAPAKCDEAWNKLMAAWNQTRQDVVPPKLLVLLDPPAPGQSEHQTLVQRAIVARCEQPGLGPVLRLTSADSKANFDEVATAIPAMQ